MMGSIDSQIVAVLVISGLLARTLRADTMLVIRNLMAPGRMRGLLATLGSSTGAFVHVTLPLRAIHDSGQISDAL